MRSQLGVIAGFFGGVVVTKIYHFADDSPQGLMKYETFRSVAFYAVEASRALEEHGVVVQPQPDFIASMKLGSAYTK